MALDPRELAKVLERLRLSHSQSKEKAAQFTGISLRQYRRLTSDDPPPARLSTIERIADAYKIDVTELVGEVTHTNGTLTHRLQELQDGVAEVRRLLTDEVLPALSQLQLPAVARKAAGSGPKGRRRRAS